MNTWEHPLKGHPTYIGETHCCACLAGVAHDEFDTTGCEFCDSTVVLVILDNPTPAIGLAHEVNPGVEFRASLEVSP